MNLFKNLEILQIQQNNASPACIWAVDFLGQLAQKCGATVFVEHNFPHDPHGFNGRAKTIMKSEMSHFAWAEESSNRILLVANSDEPIHALDASSNCSAVIINMENWQSEATLFTQSGLANILGDPNREPLIPVANYACATIAYAAFSALAAVYLKQERFNESEVAVVHGVAALAWANWKSIASAQMGNILSREGTLAEWPAIQCKDGYAAFIYHVMIWDKIVEMVGDDALRDEKYASFKAREENREGYMSIIRQWASTKTKVELQEYFLKFGLPCASIYNINDILEDPLFNHRNAFETIQLDNKSIRTPVAPHRIAKQKASPKQKKVENSTGSQLPLEGIRILDLGIITAGAGSSAILADMGAEVLKIESATYSDPFRRWAGSDESPLFGHNNRNKYGVEIDLKTENGKAQFAELVKEADVVLENFRRGVLDRIGFPFEKLRELNPNIVLASISGQGLDGPGCKGMTFGSSLEANAGFSALSSYEDGVPYVTGRNGNYPDQTVCLYAGAAIALAVQKSRSENCSLHIDVSQRDVALYMIGDIIEAVSASGNDDKNWIKEHGKKQELEKFFKTADDKWIMITVDSIDKLNMVPELSEPTDLDKLKEWVKSRSSSEIESLLHPLGIGAATTFNGKDVYEKTKVVKHQAFLKTESGPLVKGFPFQLTKTPLKIWGEAPKVGEHTDKFINNA